ncbi:MAG: TldD/PmbA family protein [Anaerolineae bacterium]|nr:TldD/PmbA family protein [Anaerolineae bacterium]
MLGQKRIKEITDTILAASPADQTEVVVVSGDSYLTRFANSTIHQNVAETDAEVRVRVVLREGAGEGARVGVATTHNLDANSLVRTVQDAAEAARLQPVNPHFTSLPGPQPLAHVDAFSESTANCTPEQRARAAGAVCLMARGAGVVASGALTTGGVELTVANSLGTLAYHPATFAELNTVIMSDTSAGYAAGSALDFDELDYEAIGREAVGKCLRSQNPQALAPGEYAVILEPYAVHDFVQMMGWTGFSALAYQEGRSFMSGKLGEQMVDPRVNIWDDGLSPDGIPLPFDFEGVPKQRVELIKNGVAHAVVYDSYRAAREAGKSSTGHALPAPNRFGPFPLNIFFGTGDGSLEEMIAGTERGIYVTRFHYTRPVEPKRVVITGMTRDGTFLIENGEIAYPVKNLRFTQSYLEALNNLDSIGRQAKMLEGIGGIGHDSVPALKLNKFNFTGATEF